MQGLCFQTRIVDSLRVNPDCKGRYASGYFCLGGQRWAWQKVCLLARFVERLFCQDVRHKALSWKLQKTPATVARIGSKNVATKLRPHQAMPQDLKPWSKHYFLPLRATQLQPRLQTNAIASACKALVSQTLMRMKMHRVMLVKTLHIFNACRLSVRLTARPMRQSFMAVLGIASGADKQATTFKSCGGALA